MDVHEITNNRAPSIARMRFAISHIATRTASAGQASNKSVRRKKYKVMHTQRIVHIVPTTANDTHVQTWKQINASKAMHKN